MTDPSRPPLWAVPAFLAAVLLAVPTAAADPPPIPPAVEYVSAAAPQPDREAQIADLEKQIADLQKKLAELKKKPDRARPTSAPRRRAPSRTRTSRR